MTRETRRTLVAIALASALAACGGGGSQPSFSPPAPTPPTPTPTPPAPTPTPPAPTPTPPPTPLPKAAFSCSFSSSPSDCGFSEQAKAPGRASVVSGAQVRSVAGLANVGAALGRDGSNAVRLHTEPGDSNVAGSGANERDDLTLSPSETDCSEGREQWWAHSILFPD